MTYAEMLKEYREAIAEIRKIANAIGADDAPWATYQDTPRLERIIYICDNLIVKPRKRTT